MTRPTKVSGISIVLKRNEKGDESDVNLDTERFQLFSRPLNIGLRAGL